MISRLNIIKDYNRRFSINNSFCFSLFIKTNTHTFFYKKKIYYYFLRFIYLYHFYTKIKNFCVLSYRRRGVFNYFRLTRMMFKYYALNKQLVGIIKSSW